ncbi:MAG: SDR family oxidoreductase, partial [Bacteroidetes bacterium]
MDFYSDLQGKVALVTGGGGVLGGAIAAGLARAGVRVGVLSRTPEKVARRVAAITAEGGEALPLPADVLEEGQLREAQAQLLDRWGRLDILVNGAGGNLPGATIGPDQTFFDLSLEAFDRVTDLNFKGTVLPCYVFGETLARQGSGSIVNISSMTAQRALTRVVGYSAAKAAIDNFTRWLAVEMALKFGEGIRVNAIAPGFFIGEQNRRLLLDADGSPTERGRAILRNTPMKRFGRPEELCGAVNWLCSSAASFVTGAVIPIDGGFSAFSG